MSPQSYLFPVPPLDPRHGRPIVPEPEPYPSELPSFLEGLCNAKCWTAKHPRCNCRCRGRWHGRGREPYPIREEAEEVAETTFLGRRY